METPRSSHAARLRADRRRAQARARRVAVAIVIGVLAVATLALTAFDGEGSPTVSRPAPLPVTAAPPDPQVLATVGNLRIQSPVAQGGVTAIGFHGSAEGALELKPVGPQQNEGLIARLWRKITGASKSGLAWYQLSGGPLRTLDVGAVAGTGPSSPSGTRSSRKVVGPIELRRVDAARGVDRERPPHPARPSAPTSRPILELGTVTNIAATSARRFAVMRPTEGTNVAIQVYPSATLGVP